MYQLIGDQIEVAGAYHQGKFSPRKFRWKNQIYPISQITMISDTKNGGVKQRLYSVISKGNVYRLTFDRDSEQWLLAEVWYE